MQREVLYKTSMLLATFLAGVSVALAFPQKLSKVYVSRAGATPNTGAILTQQIQQLAKQYDTLVFDAGTYVVDNVIYLKSNNCLVGNKGAVIAIPKTEKNKKIESVFECDNQKNIALYNLQFKAAPTGTFLIYALKSVSSAGITVQQLNCEYCGIFLSNVKEGLKYAEVDSSSFNGSDGPYCSTSILINGCKGFGYGVKNTAGILLRFANDWKITNSEFYNYLHGVEWWGGDSDPSRDGDIQSARKCKRGWIENVTAHDVKGGIWGSMGQNITVTNCKVYNCDDVGIDFEGCFDCAATGNTVWNCSNGGLATFFYNKNILFRNNTIKQQKSQYPLACIYNAAQRQLNQTVKFADNQFSCTDGVGSIIQKGPANDIVFEGNQFNDVVLNLMFNNNRNIWVRNNSFNLTKSLANKDTAYVIGAGMNNNNGRIEISGNKVSSSVSQPSSVYGICINQNDFNSSPVNTIGDNEFSGLNDRSQLLLIWNGKNAGKKPRNYISPKMKMSSIQKVDKGQGKMELYFDKAPAGKN